MISKLLANTIHICPNDNADMGVSLYPVGLHCLTEACVEDVAFFLS